MMNWKGCVRNPSWPNRGIIPVFSWDWLRKRDGNLGQNIQCPPAITRTEHPRNINLKRYYYPHIPKLVLASCLGRFSLGERATGAGLDATGKKKNFFTLPAIKWQFICLPRTSPSTTTCRRKGDWRNNFTHSYTSALDRIQWQASRFGCFIPEEIFTGWKAGKAVLPELNPRFLRRAYRSVFSIWRWK